MKSPIKDRPLHNPGESLQDELLDILFNELIAYIFIPIIFIYGAVTAWIYWLKDEVPHPGLMTVMAVIASIYSAYKIYKGIKKAKNLRQGLIGEKAVGQFLERLRESGAQIFHDIPADSFNLDHVVIHPSGIYVIETKTYSKPDKGEAKLIYDGEAIAKKGAPADPKPVIQVKAASHWLREVFRESTGRDFSIRSVVVFPGWFIEPTAEAKSSNVWVLNPKALPSFIGNSKQTMALEDVKLCSYHLSRYVRTFKKEKAK